MKLTQVIKTGTWSKIRNNTNFHILSNFINTMLYLQHYQRLKHCSILLQTNIQKVFYLQLLVLYLKKLLACKFCAVTDQL